MPFLVFQSNLEVTNESTKHKSALHFWSYTHIIVHEYDEEQPTDDVIAINMLVVVVVVVGPIILYMLSPTQCIMV